MVLKNVKTVSSLKTAVFLTAVSAIGLSLSVLCSRNNPLDPQAGNYDIGVNLLADPGFENQDTAHWRGAVSGGRLIVNTGAQSGTYCEKMVMDTMGFPRVVFQTVAVTAGNVYSASGWMKTQNIVFRTFIAIYWYDTPDPPATYPPSGYLKIDTLGTLSGTSGWTKLSWNYTAPANARSAQFFLGGVAVHHPSVTGDLGTVWFDDLSFNSH